MTALFGQMVMQQANMAMMLLGNVPHPQTGETMRDLEGARMFIDQLEMLQARTRGNLSKDEDALLKRSLSALQMAFVQAVQSESGATPSPQPTPPTAQPAPGPEAASDQPAAGGDEETRKRFSKKY